jgi:hypothetical protein
MDLLGTVLVGSNACPVTTFSDTSVQCTLPAGTALDRTILFIQANGLVTKLDSSNSSLTINYLQCAAGTYQPSSTGECVLLNINVAVNA